MDNFLLYNKLASLPDSLKKEVGDFIDFLTSKNKQKFKKNQAKFGSGKGMFVMKPGFDETIEDFKDYRE